MIVGRLGATEIVLPDTIYEIYALGDADSFSVVTINALNRGITPCNFNVGIKDSNDVITWLEYGVEVLQNNVVIRTGVNLSSGDIIVASSTKNLCNIVITGSQSSNNLTAIAFPQLTSQDIIEPTSAAPTALFGSALSINSTYQAISSTGLPESTVEVKNSDGTLAYSVSDSNFASWVSPVSYGEAIAVTDFYLFVGAPTYSETQFQSGAVFVYDAFGSNLIYTIIPDIVQAGARFGSSLAVDEVNGLLFIGSPGEATNTGNIYKYNLATLAPVTPGTSTLQGSSAGQYFGSEMALNGTTLLVTAANTATPNVSVVDTTTMTIADTLSQGVEPGYGSSIALNDQYIVIGSPNIPANSLSEAGSVYVYDRVSSNALAHTIVARPNETSIGLNFGTSVGINSSLLWVGAPGYLNNTGKVYSFLSNTFEPVADVSNPQPAIDSFFGSKLTAADYVTLISSPQAPVTVSQTVVEAAGTVYTFRADPELYTVQTIEGTVVVDETAINQGASVTVTVTLNLPYPDSIPYSGGYDVSWAITGYTDVVDGVLSGIESLTPVPGLETFDVVIDTKAFAELNYLGSGVQDIVFTCLGQSAIISVTPGEPQLYAFEAATFSSPITNGSSAVRYGPTITQAKAALTITGDTTWKDNTSFFSVGTVAHGSDNTGNGLGMQLWTVPRDGNYIIETWGASGGQSPGVGLGYGAYVKGTFTLVEGQQLSILVGQQGQAGGHSQNASQSVGSGGGGSFVYARTATGIVAGLLAAAGGGGGGANNSWTVTGGRSALGGTSGNSGQGGQAGGVNGGAGATSSHGSSGSGFLAQAPTSSGSVAGEMATAWSKGMKGGGNARSWSGTDWVGGFGGGGGGGGLASGGGGGYSGGGSGTWSASQAGGGGGSYLATASTSTTATNGGAGLAIVTGNGKVTITRVV